MKYIQLVTDPSKIIKWEGKSVIAFNKTDKVIVYGSETQSTGDVPPSNEIWYTTTDGQPYVMMDIEREFDYMDGYANTMISNTYENSKGVMKFENPITIMGGVLDDNGNPMSIYPWFYLSTESGNRVTSILLPNCVESIMQYAFYYLALTNIEIPQHVKHIGLAAFGGCNELSTINIPNDIESIGYMAFVECSSLTSVTYKGVTYTNKSDLETALTNNGVMLGNDIFMLTPFDPSVD